jgi:hypothetical protein
MAVLHLESLQYGLDVPLLVQHDDTTSAVALNALPQEPLQLAAVRHLVHRRELLLDPGRLSITSAGNDKVVHIAGDDEQVAIAPPNVETGIGNASAEAKREKESVEFLIPQEGALLQTIEAVQQLADHPPGAQ